LFGLFEEIEDENSDAGTEADEDFVFSEFEFGVFDSGAEDSNHNDTE
jgi:hypothetical protein